MNIIYNFRFSQNKYTEGCSASQLGGAVSRGSSQPLWVPCISPTSGYHDLL